MVTHHRKPDWINPERCYVGHPPLSNGTGLQAQRMWSWLSQWHPHSIMAQYCGRPDSSVNGAGDSDFYIIMHAPEKTDTGDTDRNVGIYLNLWDISFAGVGNLNVDWHAPYSGAAVDLVTYTQPIAPAADDTYGSSPFGNTEFFLYRDEDDDPITYTPTSANDGCLLCKIAVDYGTVCNLGVWEMPDTALSAAQVEVTAGTVSVNEVIRGFDATAGTSLGALIQNIGTGAVNDEGLERLTRRVLFQTPYAVGSYHTNTGGWESMRQDSNGAAFTYRVRVRNLQNQSSGTQTCYPALVLTADAGVDIRFTSSTAADRWSYTVPGGGVSTQLVTYSDGAGVAGVGLECDNDGYEYVDIQVDCGAAEEATIHTAALFEGPEYS